MDVKTIVIAIIVFIGVFKLGLSLLTTEKVGKRRIAEMLDNQQDKGFADLSDEMNQEKTALASKMEEVLRSFKDVDKMQNELGLKFAQAGWTNPTAPILYIFFSTFGWVLAIIVFLFFYGLAKNAEGSIFLAFMLIGVFNCCFALFGAQLWLQNSIEHRKKEILLSFPDALDLLLVCVESGLALDAALARVCNELRNVHPEITRELNKTRLELTMLNDRERALQNLVDRTDLPCFKSLVTALLQAEKFGTSLIDTLRTLSEDYRNLRMMAAEEKAGKIPTKISIVSIPFLLLALMILIAGPAVLKIMNDGDLKKAQASQGR